MWIKFDKYGTKVIDFIYFLQNRNRESWIEKNECINNFNIV